jgi:hypothetical protein
VTNPTLPPVEMSIDAQLASREADYYTSGLSNAEYNDREASRRAPTVRPPCMPSVNSQAREEHDSLIAQAERLEQLAESMKRDAQGLRLAAFRALHPKR